MNIKKSTVTPRERLIQTASRLFHAHGVARVGINEVIREAGIARMTLYHHFPSKDELVLEVLRTRIREWQDALVQGVEARATTPRERLIAVFEILEEQLFKPDFRGCAALNFAADSAEHIEGLARIAQDHKSFVLGFLEKLAGDLPCDHPEKIARELLLIHNGATVLAQLGGGLCQQGDAVRAVIRLIESWEG